MSTIAIIQARMGSSRLPGKSAMLLCGKPVVWHVVNRVKQAEVDEVVLAVPQEPISFPWAEVVRDLNVPVVVVGGDPNDLLYRYVYTAKAYDAKNIVRIPGDNPCVDPDEINRIIQTFYNCSPGGDWLTSNLDRNINGNNYPGGLGAEVYERSFLEWMEEDLHDPQHREHPHKWAFEKDRVITCPCPKEIARPDLRFDVNTLEDFIYIEGIYQALYSTNSNFKIRDILNYLKERGCGPQRS